MQSFILDRHTDPSNPTMKVTQDDKIPIYDSKADAEADLANIEEGGIVATKDTGATEKVVDVVQDGNMNPVTSNAVYDKINDVETINGQTTEGGGSYRLQKAGKVVSLVVHSMEVGLIGRDIQILTIPEGFRPSTPMLVAGFTGAGSISNGTMVGYQINNSTGTVTTYPYNQFVRGNIQLYVTWITD